MTSTKVDQWREIYARRLFVTDLLVLVWVIFGVQIAWFGLDSSTVAVRENAALAVSYSTISVIILIAWLLILHVYGTRGYRVVGTGTQEYRLIADATLRLFGMVAIVAFLFQISFARGYVLIAFPLGLAVLIFSRWMWRQWLGMKRARGQYVSRVVLIGSPASASHIARELNRRPEAGYMVVGACVPVWSEGEEHLAGTQVPILGGLGDVLAVLQTAEADTVVITSADELPPQRVRELSWSLEPGRQHLVVAPSLVDIGGPRIHTRPVAGLPLIHVETPRYDGTKRFAKRTFDVIAAGVGILLLSPILALIAMVVRLSTPGPVLFRQSRIGYKGEQFNMLKFRSMVVDAEERLQALTSDTGEIGNSVLFKMREDPRVTPVGRFLRRFSLDELPQLFNVFMGSMSLIGPRPPLQKEVDLYETHVHRRFLVKPGITGLWQVSGRSNLSWEDSVRLDLYYVENWSLTGDVVILWRTLKAVLARDGAY
ncbi:sugar transferase [Herbiconiux sp. CPCC 203407]|uniref:Sugar transferase n=1 Tax=Herbiconiux oxytropis TaxID=2970915 RepID=A0AA42BVX5_9MICO|nr:sugar transferase [Herbiconiux oxytropis]MCS5723241.1 sugar transferase [Herbiconiux oxytropis]MCS5727896.1 sugar transferase [Herbiconiux oxytropis]